MNLIIAIMPYISGLYTLPWIVVGFIVTAFLRVISNQEKIDSVMKNIGLIILYFFIPLLVFRIFLDTNLGTEELKFLTFTIFSVIFMYVIAYFYALYQIRKQSLNQKDKSLYLKTVFTNQGRSSAFVGGAMLAIPGWRVPAAILMAIVGVTLFAIVPYLLNYMNHKEQKNNKMTAKLPWFLRFYPWYFFAFVLAAIILQKTIGLQTGDMGNFGILIRFYTALTIPIALYYVGSGMHPSDLKLTELKKLIGLIKDEKVQHWSWVRQIFILTVIITPVTFALVLTILYSFSLIASSWFAVILINAVLPITSTNMFLIPYGIDKKATAHSVTWTTIICVPLVVIMISVFSIYFP